MFRAALEGVLQVLWGVLHGALQEAGVMRILQASAEAFLVGFCGMAMGQQGDESRRSYAML